MTIADDRLKKFFSNQKVGVFDALKTSIITKAPKSHEHSYSTSDSSIDVEESKNQESDSDCHLTPKDLGNKQPVVSLLDVSGAKFSKEKRGMDEPLAEREQSVSLSLGNRDQTISEPLAIQHQTVSEPLSIQNQTVSKQEADPLAEPLAGYQGNRINLHLFSLKERDLLTLIFWQCHKNCSLISPPITTEEIRFRLKVSADRVRNLIFRITKKGGIEISEHKSGQNAHRVFKLSKELYQVLVDAQNRGNDRLREPLASPLAKPLAIDTYSSSNYINKNTTTSMPEEWKQIKYDCLNNIGFSENQIIQLYQSNNTDPRVVQESINLFAFSLEYNEKTKVYTDPLNVIMGVLRKGQKWNEPNYISPQHLALKQLVESKKREKEKTEQMIDDLVELGFPNWKSKLSAEQIKLIVPESILRTNIQAAITSSVRKHYVEHVVIPKLEREGMLELE